MGNSDSKVDFRAAVVQLTSSNQQIETNDESFWDQFWSDKVSSIQDIFTLIPAAEIRTLREELPSNLATLCNKLVDRLSRAAESSCQTQRDQIAAINCIRLLTRLLPYIFEEPEWRGFFWSDIPNAQQQSASNAEHASKRPLAERLLLILADLLFCPDFTVSSKKKKGPESPEDIHTIDSCEYIWEAGVGFSQSPVHSPNNDRHRAEILKLLLTCFSETIYMDASADLELYPNKWLTFFTSRHNRQALPLFTSLINIVFSYNPVGYLPYNYLLFTDTREPLVEVATQILCVTLDHVSFTSTDHSVALPTTGRTLTGDDCPNLFVSYLSRIHREDDFNILLKGFCRLLNNPLTQTYLPASCKKIGFYQELLILFWKFCDRNKRFLYHVLKSSEILEVLVPILYFLSESRDDNSKIGLMHIGIFIILLLSGERNFGVRLNKPYATRIPMDLPVFTGTHADLLIIVFHKIITSAHHRVQPLYDCLLTIIVNISPYLKTLSMVSSNKLVHLFEAFSTQWFLLAAQDNHNLVFFLLEAFNNLIQYQFDGNANLVYTIIRRRQAFYALNNLAIDANALEKLYSKTTDSTALFQMNIGKIEKKNNHASPTNPRSNLDDESRLNREVLLQTGTDTANNSMMTTLAETPSIHKMTERTLAAVTSAARNQRHPSDAACEVSSNSSQPTSPRLSRSSTLENRPRLSDSGSWCPTAEWIQSWKKKLPLQTIIRLLQVLVPQVEEICLERGLTDETEILKFLQHGTLVGLLPVPHPILIRKYQPNASTVVWFHTYMWGVIYLRNSEPPIWYDTDVKLFEIQRTDDDE